MGFWSWLNVGGPWLWLILALSLPVLAVAIGAVVLLWSGSGSRRVVLALGSLLLGSSLLFAGLGWLGKRQGLDMGYSFAAENDATDDPQLIELIEEEAAVPWNAGVAAGFVAAVIGLIVILKAPAGGVDARVGR